MAQMGGYQKPRQPAPVSGPGRLSRRTDGAPQQTTTEMTGMGYGENADYNDIQSSAPLSATRIVPPRGETTRRTQQAAQRNIPLMSPTQRPEEPITAGASFGPGETISPKLQEMRTRAGRRPTMLDTLSKIAAYDTTGRTQSIVNYLRSVE
jgi:hypothetical protein